MNPRIKLIPTKKGYTIEIDTGTSTINETTEHGIIYAQNRAHQLVYERLGIIVA